MFPISVTRITAADAIAIRWPILRPGFPRETAIFDGDDAPLTRHFGAFKDDHLIGVASIFQLACPDRPTVADTWQLRGMATLPEVRGLGAGKALLLACEEEVAALGHPLLWCNARIGAIGFYENLGWRVSSEEFDIPTVGLHRRMVREMSLSDRKPR